MIEVKNGKKIGYLFICLALTAVYTVSYLFGYCFILQQIAIGSISGFVIVFVIEAKKTYKETLGGLR